jgi:hypothetical protein
VFHWVDLEHRHPLGENELKLGATWGVDRLGFSNADSYTSQNYLLNEDIWAARVSWRSSKNKSFQLSWGADLERREATVQLRFGPLSSIISRERPVALGTIGGTWLQGIWAPSSQWRLIPGLRVDRYHLVSDFTAVGVEPRLAVRYSPIEPLTLKLGAGLFHQPPVTLISLPAADLDALRLGLQKGAQFSVGAEWKLPRDFELSAEVYFSPLMRAYEIDPFGTTGEPDAPTVGRAYGLELMLRRALGGGWFGWVSYTLSRSERRRTFGRHNGLGDIVSYDTANLPFAFDQTHVLNAVVSRRFPGNWSLGAAFHFNTGIPEAGGITSRTLVSSEGGEITRWVAADLDRVRRLPPFFRFDVRVGKSWAYDDFTLDVYLDFFNAALQKEVTGYDYTYDGEGGRRGMSRNPRSIPLFLPVLGAKGTY